MGTITVSNLGKAYKQYANRWDRLIEWVDPRKKPRYQQHWVLQNMSFTIDSGEAVGVVGINGAGKSTLLKIITGTIQPTTGSIDIKGRVAALLELGMGFHPDFTGRQNAYMSGQLLGYSVLELTAMMPEIEAFAEIGEYIDQSVRIYSSGMQVRLAFAVATAIRPDVLIVDEALSVGDAAFQRKCFQRIESFREAGTTLLFVSHDIETVKKLCDQALFIKGGRLAEFGVAKQVCDEYERYLFGDSNLSKPKKRSSDERTTIDPARFDPSLVATSSEVSYGNGKAEIEACWLEDLGGQRINVIESGIPFRWCYLVRFNEDVAKPIFAMMLKTVEGVSIYGTDTKQIVSERKSFQMGDAVVAGFTLENALAPGVYYLNCGIRTEDAAEPEFLSRKVDASMIRITAATNSTVVSGLLDMYAKFHSVKKDD